MEGQTIVIAKKLARGVGLIFKLISQIAGLMNGRGLMSGLNIPLDPSDPFLRDPTVRYPVPITDINGNPDVHPSSGSHSLTTLGRPTTTYSDLPASHNNSSNNNNSSNANNNTNNNRSSNTNINQSNSDGKKQ